jgi:hypothetical protein
MEETIGKLKPLEPGQHATLVLNDLTPGSYLVMCNLIGRERLPSVVYGMRTDFIIE